MADEKNELISRFNRRTSILKVSRTAWLLFDMVCMGDSHSRAKMVADFDRYCKRHPPKKNVPKWLHAADWVVSHTGRVSPSDGGAR